MMDKISERFNPAFTVCPIHKERLIVSNHGLMIQQECPKCRKSLFHYEVHVGGQVVEFISYSRN